jgi:lysophospholipase L1-like esterase
MTRALIVFTALLASACASSTTPTPPPPPTEDPPKITCPVVPPIQLLTGTVSAPIAFAPTTTNGKAPVTTACVPASGSTFPVGVTPVACTATDALQRTDVCSFSITVLAVVPPPKLAVTRFFAFGDSITKGEDGNAQTSTSPFRSRVLLPIAQTYPGALQQLLVDRYKTQSPNVENWGNPSEAITDSGTLNRFVTLTSSGNYDAALIMEGTNDLYKARNGTGIKDQVLAAAVAGLRTMVRDAKSRNIRPFLATIPPMNPAGFRGAVYGSEFVADFNESIRQVASLENVPLVDVYQAFGGNLTLLSTDGVHPNAGGYQKIADTFFTSIKSGGELTTTTTTTTSAFRRWR